MDHYNPVSVAIAGGGIGGLCLAIGLLQYSHLNISIYEAAREFKGIGAGLALGPNAQRALACISSFAAGAFRRHATANTSADATREHIVGKAQPAATPVFSGIVAYRGLIPMNKARAKLGELADDAYMWCGGGGMAPTGVVTSSNEKLMEDFEGWSEVPTKILEMTEEPSLWAMLDHLPAPYYNTGKTAMMGDAAHATTPFQGAGCGQAIEDALVLATLFRYAKYPEHIAPALAAYDAVKRPRSQKVVETSREAMELYGFTDASVNGDAERWKDIWTQRMKWIWEIDLAQHCYDALGLLTKNIRVQEIESESPQSVGVGLDMFRVWSSGKAVLLGCK
ncbi:FAD/NAD(P)-binding domain-containing protein [Mytilinidion resinicola]|uniref:FAD/NAD(P)-binding domain-containing protein n=1 Tax=Mytilinidion resinicola TaxID=574789 RepID=A0A6A6Z2U3_9PEZI|nr:FAD/NAD(P)-binding domain-containing protein [Mytilinidion resinicola]KAF2814505.1 FAD/NAD(P)-binding domain-containing protein [Mytilinidion resinicola]